ncbi:hypothetical protein FA15DRAFT_329876 [Coprinopsis marcescibilis]|uniref:Uncharacterized protein n=1 Tax=Coprinopsis marcescibilis TaxID=230819 RepID=A0A5C3KYT0_COPMA|nr:hypothetical protein FA15DRAFT_329876 [Coprinopsis marcescibilis]
MPAKKRGAETEEGPRATKAQKTANGKKKAASAKPKQPPPISGTEFKEKALPLHVHITNTPPSIAETPKKKEGEEDEAAEHIGSAGVATNPGAPTDPGFIGSLTLLPSIFSTGSYGWKGAKHLTIELEGAEGEKVKVMLNINATVLGSRPPAKNGKEVIDESEHVEGSDVDEEAATVDQ